MEDIFVRTASGLCCKPGGFYIDPTRPVEKALITHAHSDHARAGHGAVFATPETLDFIRLRYGENFAGSRQAIHYGEKLKLGDIQISFHPAGHILGSAQIRVERAGFTVMASGDYKDVDDPTCLPFELIQCEAFITEATFGLPAFRHREASGEIAKLLQSVAMFPERAHLIGAYSLGKAQRLTAMLRAAGYSRPIYIHGALEAITRCISLDWREPLGSTFEAGLKDIRNLPARATRELERFFEATDALEDKSLEFLGWHGPKRSPPTINKYSK